ncbi:pilus assembly protein TadG-related protein [Jatrophihabitans telluris]|uniref:Pilus assembly protein TadG-related protein n=1 Tax=Jatrophihabitans telluris TaxID=2038343 RepID=A0ABY4QXG3_9ACTN|nr:pilus assembly protein TadG-related protein [Jatrophihabitans telluris]UQX88279.1 pilus assembly protein TadG-related protein [Jatrophihabitans telluris]
MRWVRGRSVRGRSVRGRSVQRRSVRGLWVRAGDGPDRDEGSTIPLILGFYVIALLLVSAGVLASHVVGNQRELQAICDGTALAAANSVARPTLHETGVPRDALTLGPVEQAAATYLDEDPVRSGVQAAAELSTDGTRVTITCRRRSKVPFGSVFGFGDGVLQTATAQARSPLG